MATVPAGYPIRPAPAIGYPKAVGRVSMPTARRMPQPTHRMAHATVPASLYALMGRGRKPR